MKKPVVWLGNSLDELRKFPDHVRDEMGYALYLAQMGDKHQNSKPLRGFKGAGVLEIVDNFNGDTYRTVYTVKLAGVVYVLHAFQKKSKKGIATPPKDMELIKKRLKLAIETHQANQR
ncbi:type II toxin-antitoxin system RelE/ParE family toxin [Pleurocapsa sp. PCC 7319]|uniref:type II toxin-antitoxin system RelE/ParE family toxin n=1 Tax=Pleurocapsa sp. PCC 7319 TaxID=118161 RepID=UPI0003723ED7|nr:type II toxin-antitoxin system RelE/ParE family toxin [Pleurocapsa sp. PCC 7319]